MSNQPYDREVINERERPLSSDIDLGSSYVAQTLTETLAQLFAQRANSQTTQAAAMIPVGNAGFLGSGFAARPVSPAAMQVSLDTGLGFFNDNTPSTSIGGVVGVNDPSVYKPMGLTVAEVINIPAADPGNPRIDIIEVLVSAGGGRRLTDATSRDVLDPTTGVFIPSTVNKTLTYNLNGTSTVNGVGPINYKTGTPAVSPAAPAVDAGYAKIAEVTVGASVTTLSGAVIRDFRVPMFASGVWMTSGSVSITPGTSAAIMANVTAATPGVAVASIYGGNTAAPYTATLIGWPAATGYAMGVIASAAPTNDLQAFGIPSVLGSAGPTTLGAVDAANLALQGIILSVGQPIYRRPVEFFIGQNGGGFGPTGAASNLFAPLIVTITKT